METVMESVSITECSEGRILDEIIEGGYITPVYQPVVSLADGAVYGYEALSRISVKELQMDIEYMFRIAHRVNRSWKLEALCREKALEHAVGLGAEQKLFLNVNPNILYDEDFRAGFTKNRIEEYGLNTGNIIFEISERNAILDIQVFLRSIEHYEAQSYTIAIDDVGAGFSGLNTIADLKPHIMKLDRNLVRGIDKEEVKQLLCQAMIDFGKGAGIKVVAEGIETEDELKTLIRLKAEYGQYLPRTLLHLYALPSLQDAGNVLVEPATRDVANAVHLVAAEHFEHLPHIDPRGG